MKIAVRSTLKITILATGCGLAIWSGWGYVLGNEPAGKTDRKLVPFQRDTALAVLRRSNTKKKWDEVVDAPISAEGVLTLNMKGWPRLLLDNTSVYLDFKSQPDGELDGALVRVTGKLLIKNIGSSDSFSQTIGESRAYFIETATIDRIPRIRNFPIMVED